MSKLTKLTILTLLSLISNQTALPVCYFAFKIINLTNYMFIMVNQLNLAPMVI